jgi:hypothetical protein
MKWDGTGVKLTEVPVGYEAIEGNDVIELLPLPFVLKVSVYRVDEEVTINEALLDLAPAGASGTFRSVEVAPVTGLDRSSHPLRMSLLRNSADSRTVSINRIAPSPPLAHLQP